MKVLITPHTALPSSTEHTLAAWRCDEAAAANFTDSGPNSYTLVDASGAGSSSPLFGVNKGASGSRTFDGSADYATVSGDADSRAAFIEPITVCALIAPDVVSGNGTILHHGGNPGSETEAENNNMLIRLTGDEVTVGWEEGAGANVDFTTTTFNMTAGRTYALAVSRYDTLAGSGGNVDVRVDLWDVEAKTHASEYLLDAYPPTGGSSANLYVGATYGPSDFFDGAMDEIHVVKFGDPYGYFARWYFGLVAGFDYSEETLYESKSYQVIPRVKMEDSDGEMVDLSALKPGDNTNYLLGVEINRAISSTSRTASISLRREFDNYSLAPDIEGSLFNTNNAGSFGSQIHLRRRVFIEVATVPAGRDPQEWDFILHFDGFTNDVAWHNDVMTVLANDLSQELESTFIMTEKSYAGTPISSIDDSGASNKAIIDFSETHNLSAGDTFSVVDTDNYDGSYTVDAVNSTTRVTTVETFSGSLASEQVGYVTNPTAASVVMKQIIDDNNPADAPTPGVYKGGVPKVWEPTSLGWTLRYFVQSYTSVMEAIAEIASQPGALISYEFDSFQQAYRLQFREPSRTATWTSGDPEFGETDIVGPPSDVSFKLADIRTAGQVNYFDLDATPDADGGYPSLTEIASDASAIADYGLRQFKISNAWNIDSSTEAQSLVSAAVSDMAEPAAFVAVPALFRRYVEVNDYYRFDLPTRHFTTSKDLAVTSFTDSISSNGFAVTNLSLRGKPSGNPVAWRSRILQEVDRHRNQPRPAANVALEAVVEGISAKWDAPVNPGQRGVDWFEVHVQSGTTAAFTPTASTLKKVIRASETVVHGLDPAEDHAVHVIARDENRNASAKSTVKATAPRFTALDLPIFQAYRSSTQSLTGTSTTKYQGSAEQMDIGGNYDASTNYRFTAPVKGVYSFNGKMRIDFAKTQEDAQLFITDAGGFNILVEGSLTYGDALSNFVEAHVYGIVELDASDTVELWVAHSDSATIQASVDDSRWGGYLVSHTT